MANQIMGPVGKNGVNNIDDVLLVKSHFNDIPEHQGSPPLALDVTDGVVDDSLIEAIQIFQLVQFGFQDGTIGSDGKTWIRLNALATRDPQIGLDDEGIAWGSRVSVEFRDAVVALAQELETVPDYLMAVMQYESGLSPSRRNPKSSATGLIQFMPEYAKDLGTTIDELQSMTAVEQLAYVRRFLLDKKGRMADISDVYAAVLAPAYVGKKLAFEMYSKPSNQYLLNKQLDLDGDGHITKGEAAILIRKALAEGRRNGNAG